MVHSLAKDTFNSMNIPQRGLDAVFRTSCVEKDKLLDHQNHFIDQIKKQAKIINDNEMISSPEALEAIEK